MRAEREAEARTLSEHSGRPRSGLILLRSPVEGRRVWLAESLYCLSVIKEYLGGGPQSKAVSSDFPAVRSAD